MGEFIFNAGVFAFGLALLVLVVWIITGGPEQ